MYRKAAPAFAVPRPVPQPRIQVKPGLFRYVTAGIVNIRVSRYAYRKHVVSCIIYGFRGWVNGGFSHRI